MSRLESTIVFFGVVVTTLLIMGQTVTKSFYTEYPCFDKGKGLCSLYYPPKTAFWEACVEDIEYQCNEDNEDPETDQIPGC